MFTPMVFTSIDRVASKDVAVTSLFVRAAVPYLRTWDHYALRIVPWVGWTQLSLTDEPDENEQRDTIRRPMFPGGVRSELLRDYPWGHLRGGIDVNSGYLAQTEVNVGSTAGRKLGAELFWTDVALWGETRRCVPTWTTLPASRAALTIARPSRIV